MRRSGKAARQAAAVSSHTDLRRPQIAHVGAEAKELLGHRLAEAGAAAGDEDALAGHESRVEHHGLLVTRKAPAQRCVAQAAAAFLAFVAGGRRDRDLDALAAHAAASFSAAASA